MKECSSCHSYQWNYELALTYITIGIYTVNCLNLILLYIFSPSKWKLNYYYHCVSQYALWAQESLPSERLANLLCCAWPILHFFSSFVMHQTFSQLCSFDYTTKTVQIYKAPWSIRDKPRFPYRGLMLGESRFCKWDKFTFCKCSCAMFWGSIDTCVGLLLILQIHQGTIYQLT